MRAGTSKLLNDGCWFSDIRTAPARTFKETQQIFTQINLKRFLKKLQAREAQAEMAIDSIGYPGIGLADPRGFSMISGEPNVVAPVRNLRWASEKELKSSAMMP